MEKGDSNTSFAGTSIPSTFILGFSPGLGCPPPRSIDSKALPHALLSQYLPRQYERVCDGSLEPRAGELIKDRIKDCIDHYLYATGLGL